MSAAGAAERKSGEGTYSMPYAVQQGHSTQKMAVYKSVPYIHSRRYKKAG